MSLFNKVLSQVEYTVSDALPYQELYEDGTVLTKDWGLMKCWHITYSDVSISATLADEVANNVALHYQRKSIPQKDLKMAYWFVVHRMPLNLTIDPQFSGEENMVGADLEIERYRNNLFCDNKKNIKNIAYACCKVQIKFDVDGITDKSYREACQVFSEFESMFKVIGARGIALSCTSPVAEDNIMTFLKYSCGSEFKGFKCPTKGMADLSDFLSTKTIDKGKPMLLGDDYVQILTINDFPSETYSCILFDLLTLPFQFKWTTRWIPYSNKESQDKAKKMRQKFRSNIKSMRALMYEQSTGNESEDINTQATVDTEAMEEVLISLSHGESLGQMTSVITVTDKDLESLRNKVSKIKETLSYSGFDAIEESILSNYDAWKSSLPGESIAGRRRPLITASNLSHIIPFTDVYHGYQTNKYLKRLCGLGHPMLLGKLPTKETYFLNLNGYDDDVGHTFIVGMTGGGKSILLSLIGSQWSRYPKSRVILFDKDMSFKRICERTGGAIYVPAAEDSPLKFMPLSRIKTKPYQAVEWLETVVQAAGTKLTPEISRDFMEIAQEWDNAVPTVERFVKRLRGYNNKSEALPALDKLLDSKDLAYLFGGEKDEFGIGSFKRKTMIEMGPLMNLGDIAVLPSLKFMFDRMDELFDEDPQPTLLVMDEAWKFLTHEVFRAKIKEWLKTLRKKRVFVIFALQNINDIDDSEEFLTSCHTRIYLPNGELKGDGSVAIKDAYRKMGVTDAEIAIIGSARKKKEYFIQQPEGSALVDFCVDSYQLERIARDGA